MNRYWGNWDTDMEKVKAKAKVEVKALIGSLTLASISTCF